LAASKGYHSLVETLLDKGADKTAIDDVIISYQTFSHHSTHINNCSHMHDDAMICLSCLLQKGFTALHHAADNGEFATATLLLNWGADITKKENVSTHCGHSI
jgi:ankyrin repeat protein